MFGLQALPNTERLLTNPTATSAADMPGPAPTLRDSSSSGLWRLFTGMFGTLPSMVDVMTGRNTNQSPEDWISKAAPHFREFWNAYNEESKRATQEEREYQSREAEIAREWSERMSSTEVQRRMQDLAEAGVNPLMAVTGQLAGGTPSASQAHRSPPRDVHGQNTSMHIFSMLLNAIIQLNSNSTRLIGSLFG